MSGFFSLFNTCCLAEVPWGSGRRYMSVWTLL